MLVFVFVEAHVAENGEGGADGCVCEDHGWGRVEVDGGEVVTRDVCRK